MSPNRHLPHPDRCPCSECFAEFLDWANAELDRPVHVWLRATSDGRSWVGESLRGPWVEQGA